MFATPLIKVSKDTVLQFESLLIADQAKRGATLYRYDLHRDDDYYITEVYPGHLERVLRRKCAFTHEAVLRLTSAFMNSRFITVLTMADEEKPREDAWDRILNHVAKHDLIVMERTGTRITSTKKQEREERKKLKFQLDSLYGMDNIAADIFTATDQCKAYIALKDLLPHIRGVVQEAVVPEYYEQHREEVMDILFRLEVVLEHGRAIHVYMVDSVEYLAKMLRADGLVVYEEELYLAIKQMYDLYVPSS